MFSKANPYFSNFSCLYQKHFLILCRFKKKCVLQRINNFRMCYFALYNYGMDELQGNRVFYATFNSLYLVSSNILLTHRYYRPDFHFIYVHARVKSVQFYITKNLQEFLCSICISFSHSREKEIGFVLTDKL